MEAIEYDVCICHRAEPEFAKTVRASLAARGFRVFVRDAATRDDDGAPANLDDIPDFVVLLTRGCLDAAVDEQDGFRQDIARAIRTERNVVPVVVRGYAMPDPLPADLARLAQVPWVAYSVASSHESLARIAHRLSSHASVDERDMMRGWKQIAVVVGAVFVVLVVIAAIETVPGLVARFRQSRTLPPMVLYWSAFAQRSVNGTWNELPVQEGRRMDPGDQLRVAFTPSADGYAYVLARDVRGEVSILFPGRMLRGGSRVQAGRVYEAPVDGGWWPPAQVALDRIYVVVSYDSIENFESLADEREELDAAGRRALVESTIDGLIDGRHGAPATHVRTRRGELIARNRDVQPLVQATSTTLSSGATVTHPLTAERGVLSAMAEIRLGPK